MTVKQAVVLLSGGLDSTTCLAVAKAEGYAVHALSFAYGQRHAVELVAAERVARRMGVAAHRVLRLPLGEVGGSALTADLAVPKHASAADIGPDIPVTYVPARNTIFLSFALAYAETIEAGDLFIGVNALDYSGYPDCRPEYIAAFEVMANLAVKAAVQGALRFRIHTPLMRLDKSGIIRLGLSLGVDYSITHSCYDPDSSGGPCRSCDSCLLRAKGFSELGLTDPAASENP